MQKRWTYARDRTHHGDFSPNDLSVCMDGDLVGKVFFVSPQGRGSWQWRVKLTQAHGSCADRDEALDALRSSLLEFLGDPF